MSVSNRHILQQGPVIGGLFRTAVAAVAQQVSGKKGAEPTVPSRIFREKTPPRPTDLVDDYVEHVGGSNTGFAKQAECGFRGAAQATGRAECVSLAPLVA